VRPAGRLLRMQISARIEKIVTPGTFSVSAPGLRFSPDVSC